MSNFVVLVDIRLKPDKTEHFHRLIIENARASVDTEPGCCQFDVLAPKGEVNRVLLYEVYDDKKAFDGHLATPHFAAFARDSAPLVETKSWIEAELVFAGSR